MKNTILPLVAMAVLALLVATTLPGCADTSASALPAYEITEAFIPAP
ncbi:hypothetical protein FACS1894208_05600 [Clostridia bacterium]|nr:hypothetical protein FACS1894208_05600 [Clostridia bacterium]